MTIIPISKDNFSLYLQDLIEMGDDFLKQIEESDSRSMAEKESILRHMIRMHAPSRIIIALDEHQRPVGMSYYNLGSGYSCGGDYVWMNCVYVKPEAQQQGVGSALIKYVEGWARANNYRLFCCVRNSNNMPSQKLFAKARFAQNSNTWMSKDLTIPPPHIPLP